MWFASSFLFIIFQSLSFAHAVPMEIDLSYGKGKPFWQRESFKVPGDKNFYLEFFSEEKTDKNQSLICPLGIQNLSITRATPLKIGLISFETSERPCSEHVSYHQKSMTRRRGAIRFKKKKTLPLGEYEVKIDDKKIGLLILSENSEQILKL
tara:strand:- start:10434 stop:10889 length:456 start_codon:yes stop_codon:yes gene_type:complete